MRKALSFLLVVSLGLLFGCDGGLFETELQKSVRKNEEQIEDLNDSQNLGLVKQNGIYFKIDNPQEGGREINNSVELQLAYTVKSFGGNELVQVTEADSSIFNFFLSESFQGFVFALYQMREGEKGVFYIPSHLAYGESSLPGLDPFEVVVLEIEVVRIFSELDRIEAYLEQNNLEPDISTANMLEVVKTFDIPQGLPLKEGDNVKVNYTGMFLSEQEFDSGNLNVVLGNGGVIPGFEEGISLLKVGEKARIFFPSERGYGANGQGNIPPFTPLMFDIEVVELL